MKTLRWLFCVIIVIFSVINLLWIYKRLLIILQRRMFSPVILSAFDPQRCDRSSFTNSYFVRVNGTKTLLISAYLEHRTNKKEVRVITVVLRSQTVPYICLFCCQGYRNISDGDVYIHKDHFGFPYGTADIMCPVPMSCKKPSHIAVTTVIPKDEDNLQFMKIQNQEPKSDSFRHNFTICLSTMFDFTNVLQLVQSLEMFRLLGVDRVAVYKTSCSPETQLILDYYTNKGLLEVIPWSLSRFFNVSYSWLPEHGPGELHYFGQIPALTDCIYRYMYQSKYVAMQDIDELILPQSVNSWLELMPQLEKTYGTNLCYMFENNMFPNNIMLHPPSPQTLPPKGCWENVSGVNILAHLHQEPISSKTRFENFKIIVSPRSVYTPTVHGVLKSEKGCVWVDRNIARMYHTRAQKDTTLTSDQLIYDGRLLNYSPHLVAAVNIVLNESRLLPNSTKC